MPFKKNKKIALLLAGVITLSSAIVFAGEDTIERTAGAVTQTASDTYRALDLFGDVFEQVRQNYVEPVEDKKIIEYALNGMLSNLDPHSGYMNEEETKAMSVQNKGEFGGLGIEVTMDNGVVKVVSPIDDTPAQRAGIQSGDLIIEIDGKQVMGMTLNDAVEKMRGKVGTEIMLTLIRQGAKQPLKVKLIRDTIQIQSVKSRVENGSIGYIRITTFNAQTTPGLRKAFDEIKKTTGNKLVGYILDLRNNPGGLLDEAISVSDAFLDKGEIVSTRGRHPDDTRRDYASAGDDTNGLPVVVLINGGSASASEIVSGALQDHKRAIIMGTQSFGKGSVQTLFNVPGGGSIRLTTARYYTPSGRSIQLKGITPDIAVDRGKVVQEKDNAPLLEYHEKDLKGALKNPDDDGASDNNGDAKPAEPTLMPDKKDGKEKSDDTQDKKGGKSSDDYQLQRAIDLLQGISLINKKGDASDTIPATPITDVPSSDNDKNPDTPKGNK